MLTKEKALGRLKAILRTGATINIIRTDNGRNRVKRHYAVLCINPSDGCIENISNYVARATDNQWSGDTWVNASAVYYRGAHDLYVAICYALHGHKPLAELEKLLVWGGEL